MTTVFREQRRSLAIFAMALVTFFVASVASAQQQRRDYIWTDLAGLESARECKVVLGKDSSMRVTGGMDPLPKLEVQSYFGRSLVDIRNRVLMINNAPLSNGRTTVKVVGLLSGSGVSLYQVGTIETYELDEIGNYVIELFPIQKSENKVSGFKGHSPIPLAGTFLQAAMQGDQYAFFSCANGRERRRYLIFDVYSQQSPQPIARIGVSPSDTEFLSRIRIHDPDEAEQAIGDYRSPEGSILSQIITAIIGNKPHRSNSELPRVPSPSSRPGHHPTGNELGSPNVHRPDLTVGEGTHEQVVCTGDSLRVRNDDLSTVLFTADPSEVVQPVQSWSSSNQTREIDGQSYTFIKVLFPNRPTDQNTGWVAQSYVKLRSQCQTAKPTPQPTPQATPQPTSQPTSQPTQNYAGGKITGLDSPACCVFPTIQRPTTSYREGMRRFRANRARGRLHAANDLYRKNNEASVAVAPGRILRDLYYFYQGTYALEVQHEGGFVVRYGEINGRRAAGIGERRTVKAGQTIGYIGKVNSNCCEPMLHFELYSGKASGPLAVRNNKFQRRGDLLDPTEYLAKWERKKFGESY